MRLHFIAIGGSIMHNLALAMHKAGHLVTGSDDEIYEPSRSRLREAGLLPGEMGWDPGRIDMNIDAVILGMHAKADNPELRRAEELEVPVYSFPEFVASRSADKRRVVIAGSHGKTTTTSMIMHVLHALKRDFDYLVGAQLPQFDLMVRLSDAPLIILEGDEYLASAIDRRPKFVHYDPDLTVITGVAWDHMNVFPTYEGYKALFVDYLESLRPESLAFLAGSDRELEQLGKSPGIRAEVVYYETYPHLNRDGQTFALSAAGKPYEMHFFGSHNFENMRGAYLVCHDLGISEDAFLKAMMSFRGADMRMQVIYEDDERVVIRDFAHAPSKVQATVNAVREKYPESPVTAVLELHTYSSLNKDFLPLYKDSLSAADTRIVTYDPGTLSIKKLPPVDKGFIEACFGPGTVVLTDSGAIPGNIDFDKPGVHLWMSSGRFAGLKIRGFYSG